MKFTNRKFSKKIDWDEVARQEFESMDKSEQGWIGDFFERVNSRD